MINVIVTYRVPESFVEENKANIRKFLQEFQELDSSKFTYQVFLKEDGVTFVHLSSYSDKELQQQLLAMPAFLDFQKKRDDSGLQDSHTFAAMTCIGNAPLLRETVST